MRLVRPSRQQVLARDYNSPVPLLEEIPESVWDRRSPLRGIEFDVDAQVAFAERELAQYLDEFDLPREPGAPGAFYLDNPYYASVDAEVLYAMVRRFKPARIVELGSGFSTLVTREACARYAAEGHPVEHRAFGPFPQGILPEGVPGHTVTALPAQDVPDAHFEELAEGDFLFVDTSHTVKLGGDVNHIVLDVLPLLAPGVFVHFHDIWLPWEYHRFLLEGMGNFWTEQYLLQAFLAFNETFGVVFASQAVARERGPRLVELVRSYTGENYPSSFWMRRTASGRSAGEAATSAR